MKIEIKNRYTKEVIFSHECKNNTVKKTVLEAIRQNCNLRESDLSGSDLSTCDLSGSNLSESDLSGSDLTLCDLSGSNLSRCNLRGSDLSESDLSESDLSWSNLRESDLSWSDLSWSDLSGSNLRGSDLRGSNLIGSNGNCKEIKTVQTDIWHVCMTANVMQIGCEQHTLIEWKNFNDDEISAMESGALEFWKNWKKLLFKFHEKSFPEVYKK